jgi:hypothetical protein
MRVIGMDIHRSFAQVAILKNGRITGQLRVELVHEPLVAFARTLSPGSSKSPATAPLSSVSCVRT